MGEFDDISDSDLLEVLEAFESPKRKKPSQRKARVSKEEWMKAQPWYKSRERKPRDTRQTRKRKAGEWDEDLSEAENVKKLRKHEIANRRRAEKSAKRSGSYGETSKGFQPRRSGSTPKGSSNGKKPPSSSKQSTSKLHRAKLKPLANDADDRSKRVRRRDRSTTPEWFEVPDHLRHVFSTLTYLDGRFCVTADDVIRNIDEDVEFSEAETDYGTIETLCDGCENVSSQCECDTMHRGQGQEIVDMGALFARLFPKRAS